MVETPVLEPGALVTPASEDATPELVGGVQVPKPSVSPYGVFAGIWAAFLPVAFLSNVSYPSFMPKYVVMLLAAGAGLVPLARLTREPRARVAAWGAVGFLAVALLSAVVSGARGVGFFGLYLWGTGWLFWLVCAGAFAIGATLRGRDLNWVFYGLVAGAGINAVMAVYQIVFQPASAALQAYAGGTQADGFLGNPVHLEALLLSTLALCAARFCDAPRRWWWFLLLLGVGLEFTSERVFIPILVVIFVVVIYQRRVQGLLFSAVVSLGVLIGYVGGGSKLGTRVTSGTSQTTFGLRFDLWKDAARGLIHHPILGVGPGQTLAGTAPYIHAGFGHSLDGRLFTDAHNFFVEVTITTGILGLCFFVAWLFGISRLARGPFAGFAVALLAVELVEPMNIGVTPLAFLALGAAIGSVLYSFERSVSASSAAPAEEAGSGRRRLSLRPATVVASLAIAVCLFIGVTMYVSVSDFSKTATQSLPAGQSANTLAPYWPQSAEAVAFYWRYRYAIDHTSSDEQTDLMNARTWYLNAAGREPADPVVWWEVAQVDRLLGDKPAEGAMLQRSLEDDPYLPASLSSDAFLEASEGRYSTALSLLHSLELVRSLTPPEQSLLQTVRAHAGVG